MDKNSDLLLKGEYFADYDEEYSCWCIFHTDYKTGFAFSNYSSKEEAEKVADEKNEDLQYRRDLLKNN